MADARHPGPAHRPLFVFSGGFIRDLRLRRILDLAGWQVRLGVPGPGDWVGVWGHRPVSARGRFVAARQGAGLLTVEDAFLRSLFPGRSGSAPLGLLLDRRGVHFDPAGPSDLETLLATDPLDDPTLIRRAEDVIGQLRHEHLSKYCATDPALAPLRQDAVLVIDQTRGDASVSASGGTRDTFANMLAAARADHPDAPVVIKTHPETASGWRAGYFGPSDLDHRTVFDDRPVSAWRLFQSARAIYTHSSTLGLEAIFAGHTPRVFGQPVYAGWGLTRDSADIPRRGRQRTPAQLAAAALVLAPTWYDPFRDRLCEVEEVLDILAAEARAWREDRHGYVASGMRLWKRAGLRRTFGRHAPMRFADPPERAARLAQAAGATHITWASRARDHDQAVRIEDGFLRSRGLGAALAPPLSLVRDDLGIYYDPSRETRLDRLIGAATGLSRADRARAARLIERIVATGATKYNAGARPADISRDLPPGARILVPGQVEDDASIRRGAAEIATNAELIVEARARNPAAAILYKPHPDVEAGLRLGQVPDARALGADAVVTGVDAAHVLGWVDAVWTITSTLGFEALLRNVPVTCLGMPFYAGWGLTTDHAPAPPHRTARPDLVALVHAVLIDYPRYTDPVTGRPCPVEVALDRLIEGPEAPTGRLHRLLAKLQGARASLSRG